MGDVARTFRVDRYTVTLTVAEPADGAPVDVRIEWLPVRPAKLTRQLARAYQRGLDRAIESISVELTEVARARGLSIHPNPLRVLH